MFSTDSDLFSLTYDVLLQFIIAEGKVLVPINSNGLYGACSYPLGLGAGDCEPCVWLTDSMFADFLLTASPPIFYKGLWHHV